MIFGTVGTHTQGFDRMIRALDGWAASAREPVVIQTGASQYEPRHAEWFRFDTPMRIQSLMREARVVVTHAGAGSLLTALECGGIVVAVPRLRSLGEHVDNHQVELCQALEQAGLIRTANDLSALDAIMSTLKPVPRSSLSTHRADLIRAVADAILDLSPGRTRSGSIP